MSYNHQDYIPLLPPPFTVVAQFLYPQNTDPHLKIPSVSVPLIRSTSSDSVVCIHGNCRSGKRSFCSNITSSRLLPNMEGWNMDFWNMEGWNVDFWQKECRLLNTESIMGTSWGKTQFQQFTAMSDPLMQVKCSV